MIGDSGRAPANSHQAVHALWILAQTGFTGSRSPAAAGVRPKSARRPSVAGLRIPKRSSTS